MYYNITGGLFPDHNIKSINYSFQVIFAYSGGFLAPTFFPFYIFETIGLEKLKFYKENGVVLFLVIPFILFATIFLITKSIATAQYILLIPFLYSAYIVFLVATSKYKNYIQLTVTLCSIIPWLCLPVIDFLPLSQVAATAPTNLGFLILMMYTIVLQIKELRRNHLELRSLYFTLNDEVHKRTMELETAHKQKLNAFINAAHEIKTPLTIVWNNFEEYLKTTKSNRHLDAIARAVEKMSKDVTNYFDLNAFEQKLEIYNHEKIQNISFTCKEISYLYEVLFKEKGISFYQQIEEGIEIIVDHDAMQRVINNLLENALKYTNKGRTVFLKLFSENNFAILKVEDTGIGICDALKGKIFDYNVPLNLDR